MNVKWERPAQRMAERENSVHVRATLQTPRLNRDVRAVMLLEPYDLYDELSSTEEDDYLVPNSSRR